jgi:hypothetical protein
MRIINLILSLLGMNRSGVNVMADGKLDMNDLLPIVESLLNSNNGSMNVPGHVLPANVVNQIESHYNTNGNLANLPTNTLSPENAQTLAQFLQKQNVLPKQ